MTDMDEMEMCCCRVISAVGSARSCYVEAIHKAKDGDYEGARKLIEEGKECFIQGHDAHLELLSNEANGAELNAGVILMHAEDQMMAAEVVRLMAEENIKMSKKIQALEAK